jgi:hypothetical protein
MLVTSLNLCTLTGESIDQVNECWPPRPPFLWRFPRAKRAGRLRPTRSSRRLLFSDIGSERTLLRRLAAVDISL